VSDGQTAPCATAGQRDPDVEARASRCSPTSWHGMPSRCWLALVALLLACAWLGWRLLERHGPRAARPAARAWRHIDRRRLVARYLGLQRRSASPPAPVRHRRVLRADRRDRRRRGPREPSTSHSPRRWRGTSTRRRCALFAALTHLGDPQLLWPLALAVAAGSPGAASGCWRSPGPPRPAAARC
jgi:hypothetical protein